VATYAIHQGHDAIVFDTFPTIDQARWQRSTLEAMGITHFTVVTSHWHNDHIAGNEVYQDSTIVMTARGLQFMIDLEADLEAGTTLFGPPAINPVVLPTQTYEGSTVLHVATSAWSSTRSTSTAPMRPSSCYPPIASCCPATPPRIPRPSWSSTRI
jgi:glyoxylase-like metal-dependent hydrolase (beta-lactamase superfamily II)